MCTQYTHLVLLCIFEMQLCQTILFSVRNNVGLTMGFMHEMNKTTIRKKKKVETRWWMTIATVILVLSVVECEQYILRSIRHRSFCYKNYIVVVYAMASPCTFKPFDSNTIFVRRKYIWKSAFRNSGNREWGKRVSSCDKTNVKAICI